MREPGQDSIFERLDRVERQNRSLRALGVVMLLSLVTIALLGATAKHGPVIEAEQFVVKDDAGRLRIALGAKHHSGLPGLVFYDKDGDANVLLNLGDDESRGLWFYNKDRIRASISLSGDRMRARMFDKENHLRTLIQVEETGMSSMKLLDKTETAVWQVP